MKTLNKHTPTALTINTTTINSRFVDYTFNNDGLLFVKSAKGTGKTQTLKRNINTLIERSESLPTIFYITNTVALNEEFASELGFILYSDTKVFELGKQYCITLDSLIKVPTDILNSAILLIDEINSVVDYLQGSDTLKNKRLKVRWAFESAIANCSTVVMLDADLSDRTIQYIQEISQKNVEVINNEYIILDGRMAYVYSSQKVEEFINNVIDLSKKAYVYCDTKNKAEIVHTFCLNNGINSLLITSETSGGDSQREWLANPNSTEYDYVICSPAIQTGVSITSNHFDVVYGIISGETVASDGIRQGLARVRSNVERHIWFTPNHKTDRAETFEEIKEQIITAATCFESDGYIQNFDRFKSEFNILDSDLPFFNLMVNCKLDRNKSLNNLRENVENGLIGEGYTVCERIIANKQKAATINIDEIKSQNITAKIEEIANAEDISQYTFEIISKKIRKNKEEANAIVKHSIKLFAKTSEINGDLIKLFLDGDYKKVHLLESLYNEEIAISRDTSEKERWIGDRNNHLNKVRLSKELGLNVFIDNGSISKQEQAELFELCKKYSKQIKSLFNISVSKYKRSGDLFKAIFAKFGVDTKSQTTGRERYVELTIKDVISTVFETRKQYYTDNQYKRVFDDEVIDPIPF